VLRRPGASLHPSLRDWRTGVSPVQPGGDARPP
jgi:hypothetical protein